jgi:OOP family OmpA-OmpF porin
MKIFTNFILSAALLTVTACSAFEGHNEVEKLNDATASGSPFTQQLTVEYRAFSNYELKEESDYADALHFARKGLEAAAGTVVMPEPVSDWSLTTSSIAELSTAYARLTSAFDRGAREVLPGKSAIAQARYDCWIEEQEEMDNGDGNEVPCKAAFMNAMSEVEASLPAIPVAVAAPQEEMFPAPVTMIDGGELNVQEALYLVFFDFDSSVIGSGAENVVDAVAQEIRNRNLQFVNIVGNTDTSGSNAYNVRLGSRRADAVKSALIARGISANIINTRTNGESDLLVDTTDGVREPANRRAVITFQ